MNKEKIEHIKKYRDVYVDDRSNELESYAMEDVIDIVHEIISDNEIDIFPCGQGYFTQDAHVYILVGNTLYDVKATAEIESAKQDKGDRLYWVEKCDEFDCTEANLDAILADIEKNFLDGDDIKSLGFKEYYIEQYGENAIEHYKNGKYILKFSPMFNHILLGEHP
jgi:hypothetical protein